MDEREQAMREMDKAAYACVGTLQSLRDCAAINGLDAIGLNAVNDALARFEAAHKAYRDARAEAAKEAA